MGWGGGGGTDGGGNEANIQYKPIIVIMNPILYSEYTIIIFLRLHLENKKKEVD
jgi:hypothetical protein